MLTDTFGRTIDTLRLSVTDRCNFRCRYCMPSQRIAWLPPHTLLRFDQVVRVARCFLELGGTKLRITGGEPLLRPHLDRLVADLAALPGLKDLGLTTNGALLRKQARALWRAGLRRINVSLDTLNPLRFRWICLRDAFRNVWEGFETACAIGFRLKLNAVVLHGITEPEVVELVTLAQDRGIEVRFIEFMPLCGGGWRTDLCFPMRTVREWIGKRWPLVPLPRGSDPAEVFALGEGPGRVGFIESLTRPFCDRCSRVRLTADGQLRPCLFSAAAHDVTPFLADTSDDRLMASLREAVTGKPAGHGARPLATWRNGEFPLIQRIGG